MLFLHLSDIHFAKPSSTPAFELDVDLRSKLTADARDFAGRVGSPRGILISGDIAFSGHPDEYARAIEWLDALCGVVGCTTDRVWSVPGNHDVNHDYIRAHRSVKDCHENLRSQTSRAQEDQLISEYVQEEATLFGPIQNYNEQFASTYDCDIDARCPCWFHDEELTDGTVLRIHGLNSTLISDEKDNQEEYKLILGRQQCQLSGEAADGVTHLAMCHHPPDWLRDSDVLEDVLNPRARVQLYGHKHRQRLSLVNGSCRIVAGAVHPNRDEQDWEPRYNWLRIDVECANTRRNLTVEVFPHVWSEPSQNFEPDRSTYTSFVNDAETGGHLVRLPLPPFTAAVAVAVPERTNCDAEDLSMPSPPTGSETMDPSRTLAHRFMRLPYVKRIHVANELELLANDDAHESDIEKFRRVFQRAKERPCLAELWRLVEEGHGDGMYSENPFEDQENG